MSLAGRIWSTLSHFFMLLIAKIELDIFLFQKKQKGESTMDVDVDVDINKKHFGGFFV